MGKIKMVHNKPIRCNAAILLNHELTELQNRELRQTWGVENLLLPNDTSANLWKSVPAGYTIPQTLIKTLLEWLTAITKEQDIVVVQGEFGLTYYIVNWCFEHHRVPLYATSQRKMTETIRGDKVLSRREFVHVSFRRYFYP